MRIGVITAHFYPKSNAGSIRITSFIKEWMTHNGTEITIFTEKCSNGLPNSVFSENVKVIRSPIRLADNKNRFIFRLLNEICFSLSLFLRLVFSGEFDLYFISSPPFILMLFVMAASKVKKIPYVVDIRDLYPEVLFEYGILKPNSVFGKILIRLEKKIYDSAHRTVTVTEGLKKYIEQRTSNEVFLIRNGIELDKFYRVKSKGFNETVKNFIILFHGTLGKTQNIDLLLQYALFLRNKKIKDVKLWVIGDGPKADKVIEYIENNRLEEIIKYYGHIDYSEIPQYINKAHIGFSPRDDGFISKTAFPVKVYEYLACGLPVIVSPKSEVGEYLEANNVGYQINNNVEELNNKVIYLMENDEKYKEMSERAIFLSQNFSRERLAKELFRIIC